MPPPDIFQASEERKRGDRKKATRPEGALPRGVGWDEFAKRLAIGVLWGKKTGGGFGWGGNRMVFEVTHGGGGGTRGNFQRARLVGGAISGIGD